MTKSRPLHNLFGLVIGLGLIVLLSRFMGPKVDASALVSGYLLFGFNYFILAAIYRRLVLASQGEQGGNKSFVLVMTFMKFVLLIGALYVLLVKLKLSGFYLAAGSLGSLFVLTFLFLSSYLRSMGTTSGQA